MYETAVPYLLGILFAATICLPARRLEPAVERTLFTAIITIVALGFVGFPLEHGHAAGVRNEGLAMGVFLVGIALGRWWNPVMLSVTYFAHGAWDLAWLVGAVDSVKPGWVVELCVVYDWLLAAYVFTRRRAWSGEAGDS